jgi:sortase A
VKLHILLPAGFFRTMVRYCFLAIASVCLALYSYSYIERVQFQNYQSGEFNRMRHDAAVLAASIDPIKPIGRIVGASRKPWPSAKSPFSVGVIGRLSVKRLHLTAMVREGTDRDTLDLAVGHIPETALPGQAGNIGVAGHRDTFFRGLKDLRNGDEVQFSTVGGDFKYIVESLIVVEPDNVAVLAASSENMLTLVTCYPFSFIGAAPKRFVVRARQVSPQMLATVVE